MADGAIRVRSSFRLARVRPDDTPGFRGTKVDGEAELDRLTGRLEGLQERLYADHHHAVLIVLQGMDTAGKDGTIRRVFRGVNPQGVRVASFKAPTPEELDHDFLWRVHARTPARGEMVLFNRSQYEDVLVPRVHDTIGRTVWERRYRAINAFERSLANEGTTVLKFFLHVSRGGAEATVDRAAGRPDQALEVPRGGRRGTPAMAGVHGGVPGAAPGDEHGVGAVVRRPVGPQMVPRPRRFRHHRADPRGAPPAVSAAPTRLAGNPDPVAHGTGFRFSGLRPAGGREPRRGSSGEWAVLPRAENGLPLDRVRPRGHLVLGRDPHATLRPVRPEVPLLARGPRPGLRLVHARSPPDAPLRGPAGRARRASHAPLPRDGAHRARGRPLRPRSGGRLARARPARRRTGRRSHDERGDRRHERPRTEPGPAPRGARRGRGELRRVRHRRARERDPGPVRAGHDPARLRPPDRGVAPRRPRDPRDPGDRARVRRSPSAPGPTDRRPLPDPTAVLGRGRRGDGGVLDLRPLRGAGPVGTSGPGSTSRTPRPPVQWSR